MMILEQWMMSCSSRDSDYSSSDCWEQGVCLTITIDDGDQQLQVVLCLLYKVPALQEEKC